MFGCKGMKRDQENPESGERSKFGLFIKWEKHIPYLNSNRVYRKEKGSNSWKRVPEKKVPEKMVGDEIQSSGREIILKKGYFTMTGKHE